MTTTIIALCIGLALGVLFRGVAKLVFVGAMLVGTLLMAYGAFGFDVHGYVGGAWRFAQRTIQYWNT